MARYAAIQIGELARRSGCHVETIRYYERIKLLPLPSRSAGRYRLYDLDDVRRLGFIRRSHPRQTLVRSRSAMGGLPTFANPVTNG